MQLQLAVGAAAEIKCECKARAGIQGVALFVGQLFP